MARSGIEELAFLAHRYTMHEFGREMQHTGYFQENAALGFRVAEWFDLSQSRPSDPDVKIAYHALMIEVVWQFNYLIGAGYVFEPFGDDVPDPYHNSSSEMIADLRDNRHLWVYAGGNDHPMLSRQANWQFRAVHDCFGHAAQGFSFGSRGEYNAAIEHGKMFTKDALPALFTETHGQNSWVNYGPFSDLPRKDRPFAAQKALAMPSFFWPS